MLNPNDLFVSGAYNNNYNCWQSTVTKYDTSSFYNWEEDNLPIYDLEERTDHLWGRLGNPTSSVTGFRFLVSSTATSSCDDSVFTSLSACMERIPEVINAPILVEVASYGNLGKIELSNKIFGPRGSIEIINRNFGKTEGATNLTVIGVEHSRTDSPYYLASSIEAGVDHAAVYPFFATPNMVYEFSGAKTIGGIPIPSSTTNVDSRLSGSFTIFTQKKMLSSRLTAALGAKNTTVPFTTYNTDTKVNFLPYEYNSEDSESIELYDASCINELTDTEITWGSSEDTGNNSIADSVAYGNYLEEVKVHNSNGPIYIRNFYVDGSGVGRVSNGIEIKNSTVVLGNCAVARCTNAGLYAEDSNVVIINGFIAYRNYTFDSSGYRAGLPWLEKIKAVRTNRSKVDYGAGILLKNSELNFSSTYDRDTTMFGQAAANYAFFTAAYGLPLPPISWLFSLSRNDIGLHAINSTIKGGKDETTGSALVTFFNAASINCELNSEAGILLENSIMYNDGRLILNGNFKGLHSVNSKVAIDNLQCKYNQKEGVLLENSQLRYNKNVYYPFIELDQSLAQTNQAHQSIFLNNGTHIKLVNSTYEYTQTSGIPDVYGRFIASASFGVEHNLNGFKKLPAIIVDSNSKLAIVNPGIEISNSFVESGKPSYGAAISVTNNSEAILKGTSKFVSKIIGPSTYAYQSKKAALYAGNNSSVKIQGPTVVARFAIDALAENNSTIEISPHKTSDGELDVSGFNLSNRGNHTNVELHSTRSCLVADTNSTIKLENLGDYSQYWPSGAYGAAAITSGIDYNTTSLGYAYYASGGSLQFYPNPNDSTYSSNAAVNPTITLYTVSAMSVNPNGYNRFFSVAEPGDPGDAQDFSGITMGGMCVRAVNGSKVIVNNVHFPCGWWNPSAVVYDASTTVGELACNRLFIWNIADNSQLDAKLCTVSSLHPADVSYYGPSGVWGDVSGAPSTTPDTSSLSILDYYGKSTGYKYSKSTFENRGPFRLYFSIDPFMNWGLPSSLDMSGFVPQVYSQGYQFSGNVAFPSGLSATYTSLIKESGGNLVASGFYYGSAIVVSPDTSKAVIDDSAANTFANAKHCSVGKSGLAKLVNIYLPYTGIYGGDSANATVKSWGKGLRSVNTFDLRKDN